MVALLLSALLVLAGAASDALGAVPDREEAPASTSLTDASFDECAACVPEQRVPRPGRVGRPAGRRACPPALAPAAGETGGLPGRQAAPSRPGEAIAAAARAHHSVLRC
ncbi:hypothetical protein GCM10020000_08140 [Streptomyces olivoverticillatus]